MSESRGEYPNLEVGQGRGFRVSLSRTLGGEERLDLHTGNSNLYTVCPLHNISEFVIREECRFNRRCSKLAGSATS